MKILFFWKDFIITEIVILLLKEQFGIILESKQSYKIRFFEDYVWKYKPDMVFLHCHSEDGDFNRMKKLSNNIRIRLPNCLIIITYHPDIDDVYRDQYLNGYNCDLIIPEFPIDFEMTKRIHEIYKNNYS